MRAVSGASRFVVAGLMVTITVLLGVSACTSADPARDDPPTAEPTEPSPPDDTPVPDDPPVPKKYAGMVAEARAEGEVSVIVGLKLDSTPAADRAKRQAIAAAIQDMHDQLERFDFQKGRTFELFPMFSGSVNEAALRYLIASDDVERVWKNESHQLEPG